MLQDSEAGYILDGQYTATNRPVQDLVTFNAIGRGELGLDWPALLDQVAEAPVEPVQSHYMRCGRRQGRLGAHFASGWEPELGPLLRAVLAENHRYQKIVNVRLLREMALVAGGDGRPACDPALSAAAGGLSYPEMLAAAKEAGFREALFEIGELVADGFEKVIERQDRLRAPL